MNDVLNKSTLLALNRNWQTMPSNTSAFAQTAGTAVGGLTRWSNWLLMLLLPSLHLGAQSIVGHRPNIIFILTDDQGYGDMSCHGHPILRTPNIDRLHDEGIRLTDYHVS